MDNLTHSLTGVMLSRAVFQRWSSHPAALLVLASNIPDVDIVTALGGSLTYLDHHRGITHALVAAPFLGLLSCALLRIAGPLPWLRSGIAATAGVLVHYLMDWTNTYGIRMLLPFSSDWLRLDVTNVVDLWIWIVLLLAVAGPALSKLVSAEIGAKPGSGRGAAIAAILFLIVYTAGRFALHERARNTLNSHLYEGALPRRVAAFPHFANPLGWIGLVEGESFVRITRFNLLSSFDPTGGDTFYKPPPSPAIDAARETSTVQRFLNFAQFPIWQVIPVAEPEGSVRVELMDLRFGQPDEPRFVATVLVGPGNRILSEAFTFGPLRPR